MSLPFGAPTDPAFARFLGGLQSVAADPTGQANERWHGVDQAWFSYDPAKWGMEDVHAANTAPGMALSTWASTSGTWTVNEFAVPTLFAELTRANASLQAWHPHGNFVWAPAGGTWRIAFDRSATTTPPPPKPTPVLPADAKAKIALVEEMEGRGKISHASAREEIARILAEYL